MPGRTPAVFLTLAVLCLACPPVVFAAVTIILPDPPASPPPANRAAPAPAGRAEPEVFSRERLEQMAAPIALYPDALLAQVLMAATYPAEVLQAAYWLKSHPGLKPEDLDAGMASKPWDPSVKALAAYEAVLFKLADNLDWTRDLGNAVLGQQADVLDAVQRLRAQARAAGNLASDTNRMVAVQEEGIQIHPADTNQVCVPACDPAKVYGSDWSYPVWYYPSVTYDCGVPYAYRNRGLYANCAWRDRRLNVDSARIVNRYRTDPQFRAAVSEAQQRAWEHDPAHRQGVPYASAKVRNRYATQLAAERQGLAPFNGYVQTAPASPAMPADATPSRPGQTRTPAMPADATLPSSIRDAPPPAPSPMPSRLQGQNLGGLPPAAQHVQQQPSASRQSPEKMTALTGCSSPRIQNTYASRGASSRAAAGHFSGGSATYNPATGHYAAGPRPGPVHPAGGGQR